MGNLRVAKVLYDFVNTEALPGTDIDPDSFWAGVDKVVTDLSGRTRSCSTAATSCKPKSTSGTGTASSSPRPGGLSAVPHRNRLPAARTRRLHDHHRQRRP
ncbi:malate synthase G domain protein [Mycobacterium xenopi 3993]|nr:malate synthase G domain protein [Mycobacterium xenopi 3993]